MIASVRILHRTSYSKKMIIEKKNKWLKCKTIMEGEWRETA
jgi:hypothetical protein